MPGKVNPVIPEAAAQAALLAMGNDQVIASACSAGNLELNQFLPLIAHMLLESLSVLNNACQIFREHCVSGITANEENCRKNVENSTATVTALISKIGYENASKIVETSQKQKISIKEAAIKSKLITKKVFEELITPEAVCRLGH